MTPPTKDTKTLRTLTKERRDALALVKAHYLGPHGEGSLSTGEWHRRANKLLKECGEIP